MTTFSRHLLWVPLLGASLLLCGCGAITSISQVEKAATPSFSPKPGTYTSPQSVSLSDVVPNVPLYYSTDAGMGAASIHPYTGPIPISSNTTLYAVAAADGYYSGIAVGSYQFNIAALPAPKISPAGGTFAAVQTVTLSDTASGAKIYYTLDGTAPSATSTPYTGSISIADAGVTQLQAIAVASGYPNSPIASATFTLQFGAAFQPTYSWKNVQIVGGGFVDGLYFHPKQQGLMYAHTDIGGAYRWNNVPGGDTQWVPLNDSIGRFNSGFDIGTQSLAIDPNDASKLYLAVGAYTESYGDDGAILISSDMGNTFEAVPLPFKNGANDIGRDDGERLVVDPNNGRHLYLGTLQNGLWESLDQAHTWNQVSAFPITGLTSNPEDPEVGVIFEDFLASSGTAANGNTNTVYYGVSSPTVGLYVSKNGGATFSAVPGQPTGYYPNAQSLDTTNNILYISYGLNQGCTSNCDNSGPYGPNAGQVWAYTLPTSNNPTGSWSNITPPMTTPTGGAYGWGSVIVDPNHPNVIMVTTLNKYYPNPGDDIFRSVDSGKTWVNIDTNIVRDASLSIWTDFGDKDANGNLETQPGNWLNHIVIDPFNSNHVMLGNGQTVWETMDMEDADGVATSPTVSNHANATHWAIGALGIEETDLLDLVSPPSGPAHLLSEMGDLGGFTHLDLDKSPAAGQQQPPVFTTGTSVDFAQSNPLIVARVGTSTGTNGTFNQTPGSLIGAYSADGGVTWKQFANNPTGVTSGGGTVAVSADGSTIVWMPYDVGVAAQYSTDNGTTWTAATGAPVQISNSSQITVASDRFNPKKFYLFNPQGSNGATPLYVSTDGAHTFTIASTPTAYDIALSVSPHAEGDLWLTSYNGLFHSTDSGATFTQVTAAQVSYGIGFGAAAPGATYPAIYMIGQTVDDTGCTNDATMGFTVQTQCVYRSIDGGTTFVRINDFAHQYGSFNILTGDPRVFGRVYFGTAGRGIIEGDSPN